MYKALEDIVERCNSVKRLTDMDKKLLDCYFGSFHFWYPYGYIKALEEAYEDSYTSTLYVAHSGRNKLVLDLIADYFQYVDPELETKDLNVVNDNGYCRQEYRTIKKNSCETREVLDRLMLIRLCVEKLERNKYDYKAKLTLGRLMVRNLKVKHPMIWAEICEDLWAELSLLRVKRHLANLAK